MGHEVETLADLFPSHPRAICVGINPAPSSVAVGHYFQGRQGRRFFERLRQAGVLRPLTEAYEDDAAVAEGFGFTDVVKRATPTADELTDDEKRYGAALAAKLERIRSPALIFSFKAAAVELVGSFEGNGWLQQQFAGARLFVMPGPYESNTTAVPTIATLLTALD